MGLLDGMLDSDSLRLGLGLLAAGGPTTDPNRTGIGQRLQEGIGSFDAYKQNALKQKMLEAQMQQAMEQAAQQKADRARQQTIQQGMGQFFKPGQQALAPLMGDASTGILPSAGKAAIAPSFDSAGAASFLAQNGEYEQALKLMPKPKELQVNKLDVKDFTPESVQKFAQTGSYADLVRMDKAHFGDSGGQLVAMNPFTGQPLNSINKTQTPDSKASTAVSWANYGLSKDRLNFDKNGGADGVKPKLVGDQWVTAPSNMKAGEVRPAMPSAGRKDANEALELIKTAREIIPKSTGSYIGTGVDQAARLFGASTGGDTAAAQLKALEGALVSKMPKMSGPQSDKDVLLYKQMAGEIGDPTIPGSRKLAALKVIEEIQQRQAGGMSGASGTWGAPTTPAVGGWSIQKVN